MQIERNAFENDRVISVKEQREKCMGCRDCNGPCLMLLQLSELPEILLGLGEAH